MCFGDECTKTYNEGIVPTFIERGVYHGDKSVLKSIHIQDKRAAERLVSALEHAAEKGSKQVLRTRMFSDANRDEIRKMFGAKQ